MTEARITAMSKMCRAEEQHHDECAVNVHSGPHSLPILIWRCQMMFNWVLGDNAAVYDIAELAVLLMVNIRGVLQADDPGCVAYAGTSARVVVAKQRRRRRRALRIRVEFANRVPRCSGFP